MHDQKIQNSHSKFNHDKAEFFNTNFYLYEHTLHFEKIYCELHLHKHEARFTAL